MDLQPQLQDLLLYTHSPLIISDPVSYHLTPIHVVGLSQLITE